MRKITRFVAIVLTLTLVLSMNVFAAPQVMSDRVLFDPEYYALSNPDVTTIIGTDANVLYEHYKNYGKLEGRLAYEGAISSQDTTVYYSCHYRTGSYDAELYITIGSNYYLTTIENRYSEYNGKTVVAIPVSIANIGATTTHMNSALTTFFNAQGAETKNLQFLVKNSDCILNKDVLPGGTVTGYLYLLYSTDGTYTVKMDLDSSGRNSIYATVNVITQ